MKSVTDSIFKNPEEYLLYRDGLVLIINKPNGFSVQAGKGQHKNLLPLYENLRFGMKTAPNPAHRLDSPTTGCLVLGRHPKALRRLGDLFKLQKITKTYHAIVHGNVQEKSGVIRKHMRKKSARSDQWLMETCDMRSKTAMEAITEFKIIKASKDFTLLELSPKTGRTHQLRVHCAAIGHPIYGDWIYGKDKNIPLHLHAESIKVPMQKNKDPIFARAPYPDYFQEAIAKLSI